MLSSARWKKFDASKAYLSVDYNSHPNPPSAVTVGEQGCKTGSARPYARTLTPTVTGKQSDRVGAFGGVMGVVKVRGVNSTSSVMDRLRIRAPPLAGRDSWTLRSIT
jgi:hypothetical protein